MILVYATCVGNNGLNRVSSEVWQVREQIPYQMTNQAINTLLQKLFKLRLMLSNSYEIWNGLEVWRWTTGPFLTQIWRFCQVLCKYVWHWKRERGSKLKDGERNKTQWRKRGGTRRKEESGRVREEELRKKTERKRGAPEGGIEGRGGRSWQKTRGWGR